MSGGVEQPALVDEAGDVIVALAVPDLVKLSHDGGNEVWRARLGAQAPAAPPVLTSGGDIVVVSSAGQAIGVSASGTLRFTTPLGARARGDAEVAPLALRDGGVAIAIGSTLLELDETGAIRARATLEERVAGALIEGPEGVLVTSASGGVWSFRPPAPPHKVGSLGGPASRGAALADARTLLAVVDKRRLVALDLASGALHVRASIAPGGAFLDGPPAIGAGSLAYVASQGGLVAAIDAIGNERIHAFVEKQLPPAVAPPGSPGPAFFAQVETKPSPPLVVDAAGRVAFARLGGRVGVVNPDATVTLAGERVCGVPVGIAPAGDRRFVLVCHDGSIFAFGER